MPKQHESVFGREVFENLNLERDSLIVDGTLGDGGHTELLLKNTTNVRVLGIDRDMRAIERAEKRLASF
ncbi:MAG: 16S rRNA (cytosine(1402)-N(4))-methyltransferase, partial [Nitrospina sp.]|nr:16S rRNA (cytosine(1402)-N(4))-methyltransferase [Nitrospina sp.]